MVDIQTISIVLASASVVAGVVYYALQLRHQAKLRQTDLIMRLYSTLGNKEFFESYTKFMLMEFEDYDDYRTKYAPSPTGLSEKPEVIAFWQVGTFYEEIGVLLYTRLVDIKLTARLFCNLIVYTWEKAKPIIEGLRKEGNPRLYGWFEYLYNEMKKRQKREQ
jgi:hypothetical protein